MPTLPLQSLKKPAAALIVALLLAVLAITTLSQDVTSRLAIAQGNTPMPPVPPSVSALTMLASSHRIDLYWQAPADSPVTITQYHIEGTQRSGGDEPTPWILTVPAGSTWATMQVPADRTLTATIKACAGELPVSNLQCSGHSPEATAFSSRQAIERLFDVTAPGFFDLRRSHALALEGDTATEIARFQRSAHDSHLYTEPTTWMVGGPDRDLFTLEVVDTIPATATLRATSTLDFHAPSSVSGTNAYSIVIHAVFDDLSSTPAKPFTVNVLRRIPLSITNLSNITQNESQTFNVTAQDPDADQRYTVTVSLDNDNAKVRRSCGDHGNTAASPIQAPTPDRPTQNTASFRLTACDPGTVEVTATITQVIALGSTSKTIRVDRDFMPSFPSTPINPPLLTAGEPAPRISLPTASRGNGRLVYTTNYPLSSIFQTNTLPPGLSLHTDSFPAYIDGVPTTPPGTYNVVYSATDQDGDTGHLRFTPSPPTAKIKVIPSPIISIDGDIREVDGNAKPPTIHWIETPGMTDVIFRLRTLADSADDKDHSDSEWILDSQALYNITEPQHFPKHPFPDMQRPGLETPTAGNTFFHRTPLSTLQSDTIHAVQMTFTEKATTHTPSVQVYAANFHYVYPSDNPIDGGDRVASIPVRKFHPNKTYLYVICESTFDPPTAKWRHLIEHAIQEWLNATGNVVTARHLTIAGAPATCPDYNAFVDEVVDYINANLSPSAAPSHFQATLLASNALQALRDHNIRSPENDDKNRNEISMINDSRYAHTPIALAFLDIASHIGLSSCLSQGYAACATADYKYNFLQRALLGGGDDATVDIDLFRSKVQPPITTPLSNAYIPGHDLLPESQTRWTKSDTQFNGCTSSSFVNPTDTMPRSHTYHTIIHEIGHALGLHGGTSGKNKNHPTNDLQDTVMRHMLSSAQNCSPHPLDTMALHAIYQTVD